MRDIEKDVLLNVLKEIIRWNKEIVTDKILENAECSHSIFDNFINGYDIKTICYNSDVDTFLKIKFKLQKIGIRYENREYKIVEKKKCGIVEYDFYLRMTDEEYDELCNCVL